MGQQMRVQLILEGGGMRGIYTAGVLDFFLDKKLYFQDIMGVSAGACNAVSYISRQRGRNRKVSLDYCSDSRYVSPWGLFTRGSIFGMDFIFHEIPYHLVPLDFAQYERSQVRFTVVSTDCETGQPVYHQETDLESATKPLIASSSIPMFAKMVDLDGKKLLDGSASDSIPVQRSVDEGFDRQVLVLTRCRGYRKKKSRLAPVYDWKYHKYPKLAEGLKNRYQVYNQSLDLCEALEKEGKAVLLRPSRNIEISRFEKDPKTLEMLYQLGYEDAQSAWGVLEPFCRGCENVRIETE